MAKFEPPPGKIALVEGQPTMQVHHHWLQWFQKIAERLLTTPVTPTFTGTIVLAMLTPTTGTEGSLTFENGVLIDRVDPT